MAGSNRAHTIAAFDFDETLITIDSLPDFIRHSVPLVELIMKSITFLPTLVLFVLHQIDNNEAKQKIISHFFAGKSTTIFTSYCDNYLSRINQVVSPEALKRLQWHQSKGHEVVIISASLEDWIAPWAQSIGVSQVIATRVIKKKSHVTGVLNGVNCHGVEKVNRFLALYPNRKNYTLYMYGDGKSDQSMFELADNAFEKRFV